MRPQQQSAILKRILLSGDVEVNPGPFPTQFWKKDEEVENLQKIIDDQEDEIGDLKDLVENQKADIDELKDKLEELLTKATEISENSKQNSENVIHLEERLEKEKMSTAKVFDELADHDSKLEKEIMNQKETMNDALTNIVRDLNKFRSVLSQNKDQQETYHREVSSRLTNLKRTVEDLKEKTWKLDNSTRSNLVFYGIKEDGSCCNAEFAVKEVIRSQLAISRDMPFVKVVRSNEEDAKGVKPIIATFEKQTDRSAVLQKSKSLKGSSIVISEDFPRDIMQKRRHLIKFAKQVRRRRPDTRLNLQYDKLYVNNVAYWFNDDTEEIEMVNQSDGDNESQTVMKAASSRLKKRDLTPSKRRRNHMSKSYSSGSPIKEGVFTMDPMLEAALDFDTDDDEEDENGERG